MKVNLMKFIVWIGILFLGFLLLSGCGTKTKNKKSEEFIEKTNSEVLKKDSIAKLEKVISEKEEERLTEYREESKKNESEKIKVTETTETLDYSGGEPLVMETPQGIVRISGNGRITRHTKTAYQELERQSIEKMNLELANKLQYKIDSINEKAIIDQAIKQTASEIVTKTTEESKVVETSFFGFWFWFIVILIILIIIAVYVFRKWLGIQFPFLKVLKFFR